MPRADDSDDKAPSTQREPEPVRRPHFGGEDQFFASRSLTGGNVDTPEAPRYWVD
jgi:hypothetical protein